LCGSGAVCGEAGHVVRRGDTAVLHEADEDLGSLGKAGNEGAKIIELAADTGAKTVVDEESDLSAVGRDLCEVEEVGVAVVDLEGDVFCGGETGALESKETRAWVGVGPSCCAKAVMPGRASAKSVSATMRFVIWRRTFFLLD